MVGGAIAFHAKQILPRPCGMNDSKVDPEARYAHLWVDVIPGLPYRPSHSIFEGAVEFAAVQRARAKFARFSEVKQAAQHARAPHQGVRRDVSRGNRRKDDTLLARPRSENVEAPLAALARYRAELEERTGLVRRDAIADRNEDHVALISLDCLKIFHEEALVFR